MDMSSKAQAQQNNCPLNRYTFLKGERHRNKVAHLCHRAGPDSGDLVVVVGEVTRV